MTEANVRTAQEVTVAVDSLGGDSAPDVVVKGVHTAVSEDPSLKILLVGPQDVVGRWTDDHSQIHGVVATEEISMDEHPATAVRSRPDSSMVVGCRLVREGDAQAFFTAGSTGAALASSLLTIGRIRGVKRPALATVVPATSRVPVLLDVGANADCKPEYLVQFALMGQIYAQAVLGVAKPTVGLLNIGEESTKGSQFALEAHALLEERVPDFFGNVEGRDIPDPPVDVIVTDGFTGNVAIKLIEGTAKTLMSEIGTALTSSLVSKLGAAMVRSRLIELKDRLDPDQYGGAQLLGVDGVSVIGHGSSGERAIASGIKVAARAARQGLTERIRESLQVG